ncbi:MAG: LeuA family protein [Gemmatimonadota bacterium]
MDQNELIYDWNARPADFNYPACRVELNDETLRDGLQSPSVIDPPMSAKIELLHLMADLGIHAADIGLPGAGPRAVEQVRTLAREIVSAGLAISPNCAARTVIKDVEPIARISQEIGIPIEAATFIGSSAIRQYAEDWSLERMLKASEDAVTFAVNEGLPVMYVTEDTTRAHPETLKALYGNAISWGARRVCLSDTVGHSTPNGVRKLVQFIQEEVIRPSGETVKIDWHGHRDRGLGMANCLAAIEAGVDRVHGTALGIGERVGNAEMDLLLVNLNLLGAHQHNLSHLARYCRVAAESTGMSIPINYPVVGFDAFRTATGVHASAIIKAKQKGDLWLADRVYSSVPAAQFGLSQVIEISPLSGLSNVRYWLTEHGYDAEDASLSQALFQAAKAADRVLGENECHGVIAAARSSLPGANGRS